MTEAPYNWGTGATGLLFLAALVGSFIGYHSLRICFISLYTWQLTTIEWEPAPSATS